MTMKEWLQLATSASVVRRALAYAVVVGLILIGINHGEALLRGEVLVARHSVSTVYPDFANVAEQRFVQFTEEGRYSSNPLIELSQERSRITSRTSSRRACCAGRSTA